MTQCFLRCVATSGIANHFATFTLSAMRTKGNENRDGEV